MKADRKKLELELACMNTEDLQKASNMPRATINNVISGRNVRPGTIGQVAKGLGVDVVYNPDCEDGETPFMVSEEYVRHIS